MVDCLIIGGGAIGLSLAYELAGHDRRVHVVDRGQPGRQTSWAGAGILPPANWDTARNAYERLRGLSHQLHPQWSEALRQQTGIDNGYRRCGGIHVARGSGEAASLAAAMQQLQADGIRVQRLDRGELTQIEPALTSLRCKRPVRAAYLLPDEAQLRNPRHLKALLAACRQRGVEISGQVGVECLRVAGARVIGADSSAGLLQADQYCITTGAWTQRLLSTIHRQMAIRPWRGQMALLAAKPDLLRHVINEGPRYLVPRDDGRILAGSTVEDVGFDERTTPEAISQLVQFAVEVVPHLADATLEHSWAGLRPRTGDGLPFLGSAPPWENLWVAAGHFRSGLELSPVTAVVMSQLIREETPQVDLRPFRLDRE